MLRTVSGQATVVLGVDIGTTSAKAVAFDADGRALGRGETAYPLLEPEPGQAVQDPVAMVEGTLAAVRTAAAAARDQGARIVALSFSGAMHSLVGLDGGGRALTPLITWADMRATEQAERLRREHPELHDRTGTPLHPMAPLTKLVWFAENEPATFAAVRRWAGIKELVIARVTGAWAVDHSIASGTGLLNLQALDWDREALAIAGIDADRLSPLVADHRAPRARRGGGGRARPRSGPARDRRRGRRTAGEPRPRRGAPRRGRLLDRDQRRAAADGRAPGGRPHRSVFCYALTPGRWVVGGAINNGGVVLRWAGEALAPDLGDARRSPAARPGRARPARQRRADHAALPALRARAALEPEPRGAYVGLTRHHGRGHLVRAALEGVCQQLALVLASMRDAGNEVHEIRATGGFARSALWRQMLADALGMPIGFAAGHEGSAFGAALLGMEALGLVDGIDRAAQLVDIDDVVEPDSAAAAVYADLRPTFASLYEALLPAFRALQRHR